MSPKPVVEPVMELPAMTDIPSVKARLEAIGALVLAGRLNGTQAYALNRQCEVWLKADEQQIVHSKLKQFERLLKGLEDLKSKDAKVAALLERLGLDGKS